MINKRNFLPLLLIMLVMTIGADLNAKTYRFATTNEYDVTEGCELDISNISGDIAIIFKPGDKLVIEVVKEIRASSREEAEDLEEELEVVIEAKESRVKVETYYPKFDTHDSFWDKLFDLRKSKFGDVHYTIAVPVPTDLEITTLSGDVVIDGVEGSVQIEGTSGEIKLFDHNGDCRIRNTSGDIVVKDCKGNIELNTTSSDCLIDNLQGDLDLRSTSGDTETYWLSGNCRITKTSGDVLIRHCSGDIDVSCTSGDIEVEQQEGSLFLNTASGDVIVRSQVNQGNRFEVETVSGNITFQVPVEMTGEVKLETVSGNIDTDLSLRIDSYSRQRLYGRIGSDGPLLLLTSTSGDITLQDF